MDQIVKAKETDMESLKQAVREVKAGKDKQIEECDQRTVNSERNVNRNIADMKVILKGQEREITNLREEVEKLKQRKPCMCKDLFEATVAAGKMVLCGCTIDFRSSLLETSERNEVHTLDDTTSMSGLDTSASIQGTSFSCLEEECMTPATGTASPKVIVERMPSASFQPLITQTLLCEVSERCTGTSSTYHDIDELPDEMRAAILPHLGQRNPMATKELLSQLQVAYIRYFLLTADKSQKDEAQRLYSKGVKYRIWSASFLPEGTTDFIKYLRQRIKNERVRLSSKGLKRMVDTQKERLHKKMQRK